MKKHIMIVGFFLFALAVAVGAEGLKYVPLADFSRSPPQGEFSWENPAGKPLKIDFQTTIQKAMERRYLTEAQAILAVYSYPDSFHTKIVYRGQELEGWMAFGSIEFKENVRNTWSGWVHDAKTGQALYSVPDWGLVKEATFHFTEEKNGQKEITYVRIRVWDFCGNVSGRTWKETKPLPKPKPRPRPKPKLSEPAPKHLSLGFVTEASWWQNCWKDPLVNFGEVKIGLRGELFSSIASSRLQVDAWLATRRHTVENGNDRAWQLPLYQIHPKLSFQPTWWSFVMGGDAVTFSNRGLDTNTGMLMVQARLPFLDAGGFFEPAIQLAGSITDSWPRYLSYQDEFPDSRAQYREASVQLQIFHKWNIRSGWRLYWFDFQKTVVDPDLELTSVIQYMADGYPRWGGPYVDVKLPWEFYFSAFFEREKINAQAWIEDHWVPGEEERWGLTMVLSRGFRIGLF